MVLNTDTTSRGQMIIWMAIIIALTIVAGGTIVLDESTARETTPEAFDTTTPESVKISADVERSVRHLLVIGTRNGWSESDLESKVAQLEQNINNGLMNTRSAVELNSINAISGQKTESVYGGGSAQIYESSNHITGGITFSQDDLNQTTDPTEGLRVAIETPTAPNDLTVYLYNRTSTESGVDVYVEDSNGVVINEFTTDASGRNTFDLGSGTVNGFKIHNTSYGEVNDLTISGNVSSPVDTFLVTDSFSRSTSSTSPAVSRVEYTLTVETKNSRVVRTITTRPSPTTG